MAWLQLEDDYYTDPPASTVYMDGSKSVIFTALNSSTINIYQEPYIILMAANMLKQKAAVSLRQGQKLNLQCHLEVAEIFSMGGH